MKKLLVVLFLLFGSAAYAYNPANLPDEILFSDAMEIFDYTDITGGYLSHSTEKKRVELSIDECQEFYLSCKDLPLKRTVNHQPFSGLAINIYTGEKLHTYYLNSGVQLGLFGENNYICYLFAGYSDELMVMHSKYNEATNKIVFDKININTQRDFLKLPAAQWAKTPIKEAASKSLLPYQFVNNYGRDITREEFCDLLANMIAVYGNYISLKDYIEELNIDYLNFSFEDCQNKNVLMLYALKIVTGKSNTIFEPYSSITREEAAVMLNRTASLLGDFSTSGYLKFDDGNMVSSWAYNSVLWAVGYEIMTGISETEFSPKGHYSTEQAITTINRLYKILQ